MRARSAILVLLGMAAPWVGAAEDPAPASAAVTESRAVMTGDQVVQILDETVDWYRTLGTQQQAATQPSDLLILYANRQTADKVMALAFEIARANAELISSDAGAGARRATRRASAQSLNRVRKKLDEQRAGIQAEIESRKTRARRRTSQERADLQAQDLGAAGRARSASMPAAIMLDEHGAVRRARTIRTVSARMR